MAKKTKIKEVREELIKIGKAGLLAVRAYGEVTKTSLAQVQYKKLTGTPVKIDFLEE